MPFRFFLKEMAVLTEADDVADVFEADALLPAHKVLRLENEIAGIRPAPHSPCTCTCALLFWKGR